MAGGDGDSPVLRAAEAVTDDDLPLNSPYPSPDSPRLAEGIAAEESVVLDESEIPTQPLTGEQTTLPAPDYDIDTPAFAAPASPRSLNGPSPRPSVVIPSPVSPGQVPLTAGTTGTNNASPTRSNITYSYVPPPTVRRWGVDRSLPVAPPSVMLRQATAASNVTNGGIPRKKGSYKLNTRPRILRATLGMAVWSCLLCVIAATGGWVLVGLTEDYGGWEEWLAWGRWWDGEGTTRITLGVAGYCLRAPLASAAINSQTTSAFFPTSNTSTVSTPYSTNCAFYPMDIQAPIGGYSAFPVPPIYVPFRNKQDHFYSNSYLLAMPSLFAAYIAATIATMVWPILCPGSDARMWTKLLSWLSVGCLVSGVGMAIGFCETWKNGMASQVSTINLPGIVLEGQQFQYGGGFGAGIAAVVVALFGVQAGLIRGFQVPEKKKGAVDDGMYDWMD